MSLIKTEGNAVLQQLAYSMRAALLCVGMLAISAVQASATTVDLYPGAPGGDNTEFVFTYPSVVAAGAPVTLDLKVYLDPDTGPYPYKGCCDYFYPGALAQGNFEAGPNVMSFSELQSGTADTFEEFTETFTDPFPTPGTVTVGFYMDGSEVCYVSGGNVPPSCNNGLGYEAAQAINGYSVRVVASTPLPAALPLFAGGLGVIGLFGRRRKRKAAAVAAA
jgi:hypothetical protein